MKKIIMTLCMISLLSVMNLHADRYRVEEKEKIQKTLKFQDSSKPKALMIDNIFGAIDVEGYSGQDVKLLVFKTIKGRTKEKIQDAKEEVTLDITEDGNTIDLYVDGPFRCCDEWGNRNRWRNPGYQVHLDFELKVPYKTNLFLKTVNDGEITVKNVEGDFEVKNVNGRIEMTEIAGGGDAHTVNGEITVFFKKNPESDCSFHTVNGDVEISFQKNLSANFRLKTFNGDAYSDFSVIHLPSKKAVKGFRKGKYVYKSNRFIGVQVGKGGPEIKMDTLNGDLLIAKRK